MKLQIVRDFECQLIANAPLDKEELEWLAVAFCSHAGPIAETVPADVP
jgi:hypothetical protein